jgi:hypothetical protein
LITVSLFIIRYHPRELQFRLCALLESCLHKKDDWLNDYVARMLKHEAKALDAHTGKTSLVVKLLDVIFGEDRSASAPPWVGALPTKLSRGSNGDELDIDTTNREVIIAIKDLINYDGRLTHSVQLHDLVRSASSEADSSSVSVASTGDGDSGSAAGATAARSPARKTFSIKDDLTTQCVYPHHPFHPRQRGLRTRMPQAYNLFFPGGSLPM